MYEFIYLQENLDPRKRRYIGGFVTGARIEVILHEKTMTEML